MTEQHREARPVPDEGEQDEQLACIELVELVTEYLDDALTPRDRARFERHLRTCPPCTSYLDQMRRAIAAVGSLTPEAVPAEGRQALLSIYRSFVGS